MFCKRWILAGLVALGIGLLAPTAGVAEPAGHGTAPRETTSVPAEDLEALVKTIEDERERAAFVARLKALIEARRQVTPSPEEPDFAAELLRDVSHRVEAAGRELDAAANTLLNLPSLFAWLQQQLSTEERRELWLSAAVKLLVIFIAALVAEGLARVALQRPRSHFDDRIIDGVWARLVVLLARTVLDILPVIVFAAAAYGALALTDPSAAARIFALALINAAVLTRAIMVVGRLVLVPRVAGLRLFPLDDEAANYAYLWLRRLTYTTVYAYFGLGALKLAGLTPQAHGVLVKLAGMFIALMVIMVILQNREAGARLMAGGGGAALGMVRRRLGDIWHVLAVAYVVGIYLVWALRIRDGFDFLLQATVLTVVVLAVSAVAGILIHRLIVRAFSLNDDIKARFPGIEARANRYLPVLQTMARGLIGLIALLVILDVWGIEVFDWLSGPVGRDLVARVLTISLIVLVALLVWETTSAMIERYLEREAANGDPVAHSRRVRTLLPLLRNVLMVVLAILVVLTVLAELGVDTAPLIAGAGILGLAIGFGAQSLVKDVITGFFIVMEDSMAVGDVVTIAGRTGVVEAMSIRSIQLRDLEGIVSRIPSSEVTSVINMTKEFSFALLDIGVAYRENVDEVIDVMRQVAGELRENPDYAVDILDDIEILGLDRFEDSAVVVRGRIKTKPIKQWRVRREYNRLLKRRFDELGIEIPFPHQTIYFGEDKSRNAPPAYVRLKEAPPGDGNPGMA